MNTVILITGCRSGFGLVTAVEAARRGHTVYAGLRELETAEALAQATAGQKVIPLQLDVTVPEQRESAVQRILSEQGRLDALVNNAGIAMGGFLEQVDEDELRRVFEVNVFGAFAMTKAVLPAMRAQRSGTVVMVSSMSGRMALPCLGAYASSKFALEGMSEAWRHELAPWGVRVVLLEPGAYATDIFGRNRHVARHAYDPDSPYAPWVHSLDDLFRRQVDKRKADPAEIGAAICDLIEHPNPALRHPMGPAARFRSLALKLAPFSLLERAVRRVIRLEPQSSR
jgi:NAD(P)-dependent dehydrogenase (short-subunit alcohol dehydrogenase family)